MDKDALIKKGEDVYRFLRKGTITFKDGSEYTYELPEDKRVMYTIEKAERKLLIVVNDIKIRENNKECVANPFSVIINGILRKFKKYGIKLELPLIQHKHIDDFYGREKPWWDTSYRIINEMDQSSYEKKGEDVYSFLKKGIVKFKDGSEYTYELSDEKRIYRLPEEEIVRVIPMDVFVREENKECVTNSLGMIKDAIENRFKKYRVKLILPKLTYDNVDTFLTRHLPDMLNEMTEDQVIKKGNDYYNFHKIGMISVHIPNNRHSKVQYTLPDLYDVYTLKSDPQKPRILTQGPIEFKIVEGPTRELDQNLVDYFKVGIESKFRKYRIVINFSHSN